MTQPERETGRCVIPSKGYQVAFERTPEVIRDELDDVTLTLLALSEGTTQWHQVYPDLTNGDRQEMAIDMAWDRMVELQRELRAAEKETSACPDCGCDPHDERTLGRHAGAYCASPDCPAGCAEPYPRGLLRELGEDPL